MATHELTIGCARCGQQLILPTHELRTRFVCPRCGASFDGVAIVSPQTPIRAVAELSYAKTEVLPREVFLPETSPAPFASPRLASGAISNEAPEAIEASRPSTEHSAETPVAPGALPTTNTVDARQSPREGDAVKLDFTNSRDASVPYAQEPGRRFVMAERGAMFAADFAARLDARLYGKRGLVVMGAAVLVLAASLNPLAYAIALPGFATLAYLLLIARVWALRDEDGNWTWTGVVRRAYASLGGAIEAFDIRGASGAEIARRCSGPLLAAGLITWVAVPPIAFLWALSIHEAGLDATPSDVLDNLTTAKQFGIGSAAFGGFLRLFWFVRSRRSSVGQTLKSANLSQVSSVIDLCTSTPQDAMATADEGIRSILLALSSWKPPRRCHYEEDYQQSILLHLRKKLDGTVVSDRKPLRDEHGALVGYPDVQIADAVLLELKCTLSAAAADRAVGQVIKYADAWNAGPLVLVLCETRADFAAGSLARRIGDLRAQGRPMLCVAAGRRMPQFP